MAEKKLRKFALREVKCFLLYVAVVIFFVLGLILTIMFIENIAVKLPLIIYEVAIILIAIGIPIFTIAIHKKESKHAVSKDESKHTVSKEEFNQYVKQAKRCDIHAK